MRDIRRHLCQAAIGLAFLSIAVGTVKAMTAPASNPASGEARTTIADPSPMDYGTYSGLVSTMELTAKQQAAIKEAYARQRQAQEAYLGKVSAEWGKAMEDAAAGDAAVAKAGKEKVAKLQAGFDAITGEHQAKVMSAPSAAEALAWQERQIRESIVARIRPVRIGHGPSGVDVRALPLTEEQTKVVNRHASEAAKQMQAWANPWDPAKGKELIEKLVAAVSDELKKAGIMPAKPSEE